MADMLAPLDWEMTSAARSPAETAAGGSLASAVMDKTSRDRKSVV